ncbi:hypothetical protein SNE40_006259 [Patella caerulea]|uniref:Peptidase M12B domain-containing protein n=1 Tax=Patella caerulea TaxID=87958 RepID=A0AAN8K001_PATCE
MKYFVLPVLSCCISLCYTASLSLEGALHKPGDAINVKVSVADASFKSMSDRQKREATHMPSDLDVEITSPLATSKLRLTRSPFLTTYVMKNGQKTRVTDFIHSQAIYVDRKKRAAFHIRRSAADDGGFSLEGNLIHGSQNINIAPESRNKRDTGIDSTHRIVEFQSKAFGDDYIKKEVRKRSVDNMELNHREKRQVSSHVIEITFITDAEDYFQYLALNNNDDEDTVAAMTLHYTFVAQQIQIRYDSVTDIDPDFTIRTVITELIIIKDRSQSTFTENIATNGRVDAAQGLQAASQWAAAPVGGFTFQLTDHYMFFTGYDLTIGGQSSSAGRAFFGELCQITTARLLSVSIVEDDKTSPGTGGVAAHELGHILRADHDGESPITCADENFVMSSSLSFPDSVAVASNPFIFSVCSVQDMKAYLQRTTVTCDDDDNYGAGALTTTERAGQLLDADAQCRRSYGDSSFLCRSLYVENAPFFAEMCYKTFCDDTTTCRAIFPEEFTSCGDGKWCIKGQCVADAAAPSRPSGKYL